MAYRGDDRQSEFSNYVNTINSFESEYAQLNPFFNKNRPSQVQEVEEDSSSDDESSSDDGSVERKSFVTLEYDNEDDDDDESEDEDESENESEIDSGTEDEDEDDEDESSNSDSIEARYNMPQDIFTDEGQGQRTDRENITALESTMGELESSLKRYIRRLTILVAFTCLGLVILAILFALDPFSDEIVIPRLTAPPSNAPTFSSSDGTTVTTTYSALVPNDVSFDSITPDLIESMDKLAQEVLLEVTTSRKRTKRRILAEYEVRIPTSIAEAVDFGKYF